jgi:hypothetical protein
VSLRPLGLVWTAPTDHSGGTPKTQGDAMGRNGTCDTLGEAVGPATGSQDLAHHVLWPDCSFLRARAFKSRASNLLAGDRVIRKGIARVCN